MTAEWVKLDVLNQCIDENDLVGHVEFKAFFVENNQYQCLHEKSRFLREVQNEKQQWFYIDGVYPKTAKIGRNDPCFCGSQKKHKKCCAK